MVRFSLPSFASNLEQVANLMCAQQTQPPTLRGRSIGPAAYFSRCRGPLPCDNKASPSAGSRALLAFVR